MKWSRKDYLVGVKDKLFKEQGHMFIFLLDRMGTTLLLVEPVLNRLVDGKVLGHYMFVFLGWDKANYLGQNFRGSVYNDL